MNPVAPGCVLRRSPALPAETAKGVLQEHLTTTFLYTGLFQSIPLLRPLKARPCMHAICDAWSSCLAERLHAMLRGL